MANQDKTPQIRFAGFTGDWEQKRLEELALFSKGHGYLKSDLKKSGTPVILYGQMYTNYKISIDDVDIYAEEKPGSVYSSEGDVIVPASGESAEDIARASVVENAGVLLGGDLNIIKPSKEIISVFLALTISNGKRQKELSRRAQGKSVAHLHNSDLKEINLLFPDKAEQTRIGNFFRNLDNLITQNQQELEKLKIMKKAMLEKMFPKAGAAAPEIRFAGFTGDWERRKLGEIGKTFSGLSGKTKEDFGSGDARYITYMNVFLNPLANKNGTEKTGIDKKQNQVMRGDVLFTTSSETPEEVGMSSVWLHDEPNIYLNSFCFGFRADLVFDYSYFAFFLRSQEFRRKMELLAQGISRYNISKNRVMDIRISLPSLLEQTRIGNFFRNLDTLITQHQRKLDKLVLIKKAMLGKMFV